MLLLMVLQQNQVIPILLEQELANPKVDLSKLKVNLVFLDVQAFQVELTIDLSQLQLMPPTGVIIALESSTIVELALIMLSF